MSRLIFFSTLEMVASRRILLRSNHSFASALLPRIFDPDKSGQTRAMSLRPRAETHY